MKYEVAVFIGRFQPFHVGHYKVVMEAMKQCRHLIIGIGSANVSRSTKNPFTYEERVEFVKESIPHRYLNNVHFVPLNDYLYDDNKWLLNTRKAISNKIKEIGANKNSVALIGHKKDNSSYYLAMFPEWKSIDVPNYENISATDIRKSMFEGKTYSHDISTGTYQKIIDLKNTKNVWENLQTDYDIVKADKKSWENAPYPPIFVTVDNVVVCSGHILLVQRGGSPGKGLYALPGGFLNHNEKIIDGAIRELREETMLKVPEPVLRGNIVQVKVFDHPDRSSRGRTITHACYINLGMQQILPKIKGADDAVKAEWVPIKEIDPRKMFEDHYDIISYFIGLE